MGRLRKGEEGLELAEAIVFIVLDSKKLDD